MSKYESYKSVHKNCLLNNIQLKLLIILKFQLEVFLRSPSRPVLGRTKCSNDTSPWTEKYQESISDGVIQFYENLSKFLCISAESAIDKYQLSMISSSILFLLNNEKAKNSTIPIYVVANILKRISVKFLKSNQDLLLRIVECYQILWPQLSDTDKIPLVQSITNLVSLPDEHLIKYFARNVSELVIIIFSMIYFVFILSIHLFIDYCLAIQIAK